jgi:type IV secretion system protein VirB9
MTRYTIALFALILPALPALAQEPVPPAPALPPEMAEDAKPAPKPKKEEIAEPQVAGESDGRIRMLSYDPNDIYTIYTRVGYQSHVEFAEREEVETISVGDRSFWQLIPSGNRLFIRPLQEDVATNMTVITNKRAYQFDIKSVANEKQKIVYVARFYYPEDRMPAHMANIDPFLLQQPSQVMPGPATYAPPVYAAPAPTPQPKPVVLAAAPAPQPMVAEPRSEAIPLSRRNYFYTYSGPEGAAPYEVFDDGHTTYFRYPHPAVPAPIASVPEKGGRERALAVYRKGGYYAVDAVDPELILRAGGETVFLYNETLAPNL